MTNRMWITLKHDPLSVKKKRRPGGFGNEEELLMSSVACKNQTVVQRLMIKRGS